LLACHSPAYADESTLDEEALPQEGAHDPEWERLAAQLDPTTDDARERCVLFHQRGVANVRLGRYEQAVTDLKQALALQRPDWAEREEWCARYRLQSDLWGAYLAVGDQFAQIGLLQDMATEWRKKNVRRYLYTQLHLINPYVALGMLKEADQVMQQASDVLPEVRRRKDWERMQYNVNDVYSRSVAWMQELKGNYVAAEQMRREALDSAKRYLDGLHPGAKDERIARGNVATTSRQLANILAVRGRLGEAEYFANQGLRLTLADNAFNTVRTGNALSSLAAIKLQRGDISGASHYEELALKALERSGVAGYAVALSGKRARLGFIREVQARWQDALALFEERDRGLRSNPAQWAKFGSGNLDWALAMVRTGRAQSGSVMLQRLLERNLQKPFVDPLHVAYLRGYLGTALVELGDDKAALAQFEQALPELLKRSRQAAENEEAGFVGVYRLRVILDAYLELLARLHSAGQPGQDWAAEAFKIADVARNSAVQRALTASAARAVLPDPQLAELARREQDASNRIQALSKLLASAAAAPERQRSAAALSGLQHDIAEQAAQQAALRREIARRFPDYASLIDPPPAGPAEIQLKLRPGEALVSIYSGERQAYVWTVTPSKRSWRIVALPREQIARDVARLRQELDISDDRLKRFDVAAAYRLYASLLAPDAALWADAKLLDIIPHGALGELPLASLLTAPAEPVAAGNGAAYAKLPWLIDKVALAQQPSASGFLALRSEQAPAGGRKPFIGFGNPLFSAGAAADQSGAHVRRLQVPAATDMLQPLVEQAQQSAQPAEPPLSGLPTLAQAFSLLPALPDTADELREIARTLGADAQQDLYLGARASKSNLKRADLAHYRVLAFATHGLKAGELTGLDQPALVLSNPALTHEAGDDGFLKLDDVLGLKLDADWVVLSACNTASADGSGSEAVSGLGRGFFYAGARSVLVSNWAVDSESARLLTTGLFRQQASHPGMSRAEALRQSMLELKKVHPADYGHPVFWAPFSLVGDGQAQ
jgi:CHAT domain-containing protein